MEFQPKDTGSFDTPEEAEEAAWNFVRGKIAIGSVFDMIWNDWAEE